MAEVVRDTRADQLVTSRDGGLAVYSYTSGHT